MLADEAEAVWLAEVMADRKDVERVATLHMIVTWANRLHEELGP